MGSDPEIDEFVRAALHKDLPALQRFLAELDPEVELRLSAATATMSRQFGPYRLDVLLGAGGMGEVYRATDTRLNRTLAIKTMRFSAQATADEKQRFLREAKAVAALNHPNIVTLYDLAVYEGLDYLVMEYVPGDPLSKAIPPTGLPLEKTIDYAIQIACALEAAHSAGVVHRDIKPANAVITAQGQLKLLDFGLAKLASVPSPDGETQTIEAGLTTSGMVMGTFAYMSPEQARGESVDARTDLFSFGALLYEMATGRRAFPKRFDWSMPGVDSLPPALRPIVIKLLAPDRLTRYASATDVLADLRRLVRPPAPRLPTRWLVAGAATLLIAGAAAFYFLRPQTPLLTGPAAWTQLTSFPDSVSQPALSPDGRILAFVRGQETFLAPGQIYVKTLPSGDPVALTSDSLAKMHPLFSPDGQSLTYSASPWDTWSIPVVGGQPRLWLKNASGLAWTTPDRLFYSEMKAPAFMGLATSAPDRSGRRDIYVPTTPHGMAHRTRPSPDGKTLLVIEMDRGNWLPCRLVPADGSNRGRPVGGDASKCTDAAWDPSGKWMYLTLSTGGAFHIWRQRFPDGPLQQVTAGVGEEEGVAMFPGGKSFVTAVAQRQSTVWLHEPAGERQISLEGYSFDPQFTPSGKHLLYRILGGAMTNYDPGALRVVDLESGRNEPLFPGVAVFGPAGRAYSISPDGLAIAAAGFDRGGKRRIWAGPLDRQAPPHMIPAIEGDSPLFTSNNEICFRKLEGSAAFAAGVHLDGAGLRKISPEPISMLVGVTPGGDTLIVWGMNRTVNTLSVVGGAHSLLLATGDSDHVAWSADQTQLLFSFPLGATASHLVGKTYIVPLPRGQLFPPIPAGGFTGKNDLESLPGVTSIGAFDTAAGPSPGVYAYSKSGVQRNLFKVPLP